MSFDLTSVDSRVRRIIEERVSGTPMSGDVLSADQLLECVQAGLKRYSDDFNRIVHQGFAGNGTFLYKLTGPDSVLGAAQSLWIDEWSKIKVLRYPYYPDINDAQRSGQDIQSPCDYGVFREAGTLDLSTVPSPPAAGIQYLRTAFIAQDTSYVVLTYTTRHELEGADDIFGNTSAETTVYPMHFEAFATLVAWMVARSFADRYGHTANSTLGADVVDYSVRSEAWRNLTRDLHRRYKELSEQSHEFSQPFQVKLWGVGRASRY